MHSQRRESTGARTPTLDFIPLGVRRVDMKEGTEKACSPGGGGAEVCSRVTGTEGE